MSEGFRRTNGRAVDAGTPPALIQALRTALVPALSLGTWEQIAADHAKVALPWRTDLNPGSGKPKYVGRVLDELEDEDVVAVARRALGRITDRSLVEVENALLWVESAGEQRVSEVTRLGLATALDRQRLHPTEGADALLSRFAKPRDSATQFDYAEDGTLLELEDTVLAFLQARPPLTRASSCLALLDAYGFLSWPDARLFQFLEFIVHPVAVRGEDQAGRVGTINSVLAADRFELAALDNMSGHPVFRVRQATNGVGGRPKNIIFASTGPKPELGFVDAVNNDIVILKNAEHCLIYEEHVGEGGLTWQTLAEWWAMRTGLVATDPATRSNLGRRLAESLASLPEKHLFRAYFKVIRPLLGEACPALIPQVYLHYDPVTLRELRARGESGRFDVQRMDFLLLLQHGARVIVEVDGQQHYSTGIEASARPSPYEYARTVRSDRNLRLLGYEVYRFGGYELRDDSSAAEAVKEFFIRLFRRHRML